MLDLKTFKILFYCLVFISCVAFFLASSSICLAGTLVKQPVMDNQVYENIGESYLYQPFISPISLWATISGYDIYICSWLATCADIYHRVYMASADTVNDCLDPLYGKCYVPLTTDYMPAWDCNAFDEGFTDEMREEINLTGEQIKQNTSEYCQTEGEDDEMINNNVLCGIAIESTTQAGMCGNLLGIYGEYSCPGDCDGWPYGYNFNTSTSSYPLYFEIKGTATMQPGTDCYDCSDIVNDGSLTGNVYYAIACSLRSAGCFFFVPDTSIVIDIGEALTSYKSKFPFTLWYSLTDTVNLALATSTNETGTLGIPFIKKTATSSEFYILPVLSSSTMPAAIGAENTTKFKNGILYFGWAGVVGIIITSLFFI